MKKFLLVLLSAMMLLTCVACSGNNDNANDNKKQGTTYSIKVDSLDMYNDTYTPVDHLGASAQAWSPMRYDYVLTEVTFYDDGTYFYKITDACTEEKGAERWMERNYTFTGTYTEENGVYTLNAPTEATKHFQGGSTYDGREDIFGEMGDFTQETNPELLEMFTPSTATIDGDTITFDML